MPAYSRRSSRSRKQQQQQKAAAAAAAGFRYSAQSIFNLTPGVDWAALLLQQHPGGHAGITNSVLINFERVAERERE
jgi:hypothetical protein